ncbi:MAG: protein phosphatase 2C family protein, partial [Mycoplasmataceae bacterium]|nr:protein phosphatase 2C family protein [Mycoplasmataceae bacterium]
CCLETNFHPLPEDTFFSAFKIHPNDLIIVCTDGVYNWTTPQQWTAIIEHEKEFQLWSAKITAAALNNRSDDNCTCALVRYE